MELRTVNSYSWKSLWLRVSVCDCVYVWSVKREREKERFYLLECFSQLISAANSVNVTDRYQAIYVNYSCRNQCAQFKNTTSNRCGLQRERT